MQKWLFTQKIIMIYRSCGAIKWLEFELFAEHPELIHGCFQRHGGCSAAPYLSLNFCKRVGDEIHSVQSNLLLAATSLNLSSISMLKQLHSSKIVEDRGECGDALFTTYCNRALLITHADCQAAIFFDPLKKMVANVHAGWRGSVKNIYKKVVRKFVQKGSCPANLLVAISPSLGPNHAQFIHYQKELPLPFWHYQIKPNFFDFWSISTDQLTQCGILPHHIQIASVCTYENSKDYFSYRRDSITGRHATVAMICSNR